MMNLLYGYILMVVLMTIFGQLRINGVINNNIVHKFLASCFAVGLFYLIFGVPFW